MNLEGLNIFGQLSAQGWNIYGLVFNALGVVILFRFGMPFRVITGGKQMMELEQEDKEAAEREELFVRLGYFGIGLIILGNVFQIAGNTT